MISVCMATHDGERYLRAQLASVLAQLAPDDEVIVVDDRSADASVQLVESFEDIRIRMLSNPQRLGAVRTFERAIEAARGELIFLCDQDDIWLPGKVARFIETFAADPRTMLVISDAQLVDAEGGLLAASFFAQRGGFTSSLLANLAKNRYLGCTMAFRATLRQRILPFPPDLPMHDMWIGNLARLTGKVAYIDTALIAYRRHGDNATSGRRAGLAQMLVWRWRLARSLLVRALTGR